MIHAAVRAVPGTLLFHSWSEARELWDRLVLWLAASALVLMPDHLHALLAGERQRAALSAAIRGYAEWRNHARGEHGPVFVHGAQPTPIRGRDHLPRTVRYLHLNPCRKRLVDDPLAWPFSTYRDALGLAVPAACRPVRDPAGFHAYVSSDPCVNVAGTPLPAVVSGDRRCDPREVVAAVSALTRTPLGGLRDRGAPRDLLLRALCTLTDARAGEIAALAGVDPRTARRHAGRTEATIALVARVAGDPRFAALGDGDLRQLPSWARYRHLR